MLITIQNIVKLKEKGFVSEITNSPSQVKAGNNSESLLNEIKLFIFCINLKK